MGVCLAAFVVILGVPEILRFTGVSATLANLINLGTSIATVASLVALYWLVTHPLRQELRDARRRGECAYLVHSSGRWTEVPAPRPRSLFAVEAPPMVLRADDAGVAMTSRGRPVFEATWKRLGEWNAEYANTLAFRVDGEVRRVQILGDRWALPVRRSRVRGVAAELDALRASASDS